MMRPYAEPVPVPKKGQAIRSKKSGIVGYSLGRLVCDSVTASETQDGNGDTYYIDSWEPVEIVRNGRYSKALELLWEGTKDMATCDLLAWNRAVLKFIGEEPKGE